MAFLPAAPLPRRARPPALSTCPPTMIRAPPRVVSAPTVPPLSASAPPTAPPAPVAAPSFAPADPPAPAADKPRRRTKAAAIAARTPVAAVDHLVRSPGDHREYYYHDLPGSPSARSPRLRSSRVRAPPSAAPHPPPRAIRAPSTIAPLTAPPRAPPVPRQDDLHHAEPKPKEKKVSRTRRPNTDDSVRSYLHEIGEVKLLDAESEINLAREIAKLLELERISARLKEATGVEPAISAWAAAAGMDIEAFRDTLRKGLRAKEHMVAANLRLVVSIAKKYLNRGLSFQDLIQEGSIGLIRGAEKFDGNKGFKFSTYATWWIRQAITRAIADHSRPIRLPVHVNDTIAAIKKTTKHLSSELDRPPTEAEIAERMQLTVEKLRFLARSSRATISLETPIGRDGKDSNATLGSFIVWDGDTPEQSTMKSLLREDLENVLNTLSPRERDVVRMRYGFDDGKMKTLEEIGSLFAVTRERIRQIEAKALRKLRHPNRNAVLREYVYEEQ